MARQPRGDELPASPVDWEDIPLGVGQDPGHGSGLQWSDDLGAIPLSNNIRRKPGEETTVIVRPPERPY